MDVVLAKTFLAIMEVGNFRTASETLNVTQSTVSARVKVLEEQLGKTLFIRNKSGATATEAGQVFHEYALSFVQLWERALTKVSSENLYIDNICVGARSVLWEPIIMNWLPWAKKELPDLAYTVQIGMAPELIRKLEDGIIDIAVLLSAPSIPGITVEELYLEQFLLVATPETYEKSANLEELIERHYIEADWGSEFQQSRQHYFPLSPVPQLSINQGLYGLKYMNENGGCGYFPHTMVSDQIYNGELMVIPKAPKISQPAYIAYNKDELKDFVVPLLKD